MFSFFRKKSPASAPASPVSSLATDDAVQSDAALPEPAPPGAAATPGAVAPPGAAAPLSPVDEEPEPLLTFEEWDRLLAEQAASQEARAANRRGRRPEPRPVEAVPPTPQEEPAPAPPAPAPMPVAQSAPTPSPARRDETPLEALLRQCDDDPYDAELAHSLARLALSSKRADVAVAPLVRTASLLMGSDPNTAVELLSRLLNMRHDTLQSDLILAQLCLDQDRMREAEQALRAALRHDPEDQTASLGMIRVSLAAGRAQEAVEFCHRVLAVDAERATVWEQLGDAHVFTGSAASAAEAWITAARLFAHQQQISDAIRVYGQILTVDPHHPTAAQERANLGFSR